MASHPVSSDLRERIRRRAEEIYFRSGCVPGRDLENWAQAERDIRDETEAKAARTAHRTAVIINVSGTLYVGEYAPDAADGYRPGEISEGASVVVRFDGEKMFLKRPNGRELKTTVVEKTAKKVG